MHLRRFVIGDEAALWNVYHSAIHQVASRDYTEEQVNAWAPDIVDPDVWARRMRVINPYVAEQDGNILGYADLQPDGYIDHFFVSGEYGGMGAGAMLMNRLLKEAARLGLQELTSDVSKTAQPFFARYGFEVVEQRTPIRNGVVLSNALMRKAMGEAPET